MLPWRRIFFPVLCRSFSGAPAAAPVVHNVDCRTPESDPREHSLLHEARFYQISSKTNEQLFRYGGIPRSFQLQVDTFQELCLMVRHPALEIMESMKLASPSRPATKYVVYGVMGSGKSLTLAHVLHFAYTSGWIIVHVPWLPNWIRSFKEVAQSSSRPGMIEHPLDAALWLQHFLSQNASRLQELKLVTSRRYEWSGRESTDPGVPLQELVEMGVARVKFACSCLEALVQELQEQASKGLFQLLVAVDGANALFLDYSRVKREDHSMVPPTQMLLPLAFHSSIKAQWNNGMVLAVVDQIAAPSPYPPSHLPWSLLGERGFKHLDPFVPLEVPPYSVKELESCLDYYQERKWLQHPSSHTPEGRKQLAFLSTHNPYQLMKITAAY